MTDRQFMNNDLISRDALIKWIDDSVSQYGHIYSTDMLNMWGLFKDYLINNVPSVEPSLNLDNITDEEIKKFKLIWQRANSKGLLAINEDKPQGDCQNCDFRKFTEKFIGGVVELMNENDITSLEKLSEMLERGKNDGSQSK